MREPAPLPPAVLITRPEPAGRRFAARIAGLGLRCVVAPLQRIVPVPHDARALKTAKGLVFTSENAVPFAGPGAGRPAFCVGPRTAERARAAGFVVTEGPGDAAGLMPMLQDLGPGWVHPHGAHLAARLPMPGVVVYDQQALPLPAEGMALLQGSAPVILPLFSPRSAGLAAGAARDAAAPLWIAPISPAAEAAWAAAWTGGLLRSEVADRPDAEGIVHAIHRLLDGERAALGAG